MGHSLELKQCSGRPEEAAAGVPLGVKIARDARVEQQACGLYNPCKAVALRKPLWPRLSKPLQLATYTGRAEQQCCDVA